MIEKARFVYSYLEKVLKTLQKNKQKQFRIKRERLTKAIEEHTKKLAKNNASVDKRDNFLLLKERQIFKKLIARDSKRF